jgi:hypothetical protein
LTLAELDLAFGGAKAQRPEGFDPAGGLGAC